MGTEGLSGLDDIRSFWVCFFINVKGSKGTMDNDAILEKGIDEFCGSKKISLVGGNDVGPRVALIRIMEHLIILQRVALSSTNAYLFCLIGLYFLLDFHNSLWMDSPVVTASLLYGILSHPKEIEEKILAVLRG